MSSITAAAAPRTQAAIDVPVLVPRRADGGRRDQVWAALREKVWPGWTVVEGHHDGPGPFNRSAALNTAASLAGDWTVAVIADADSFVPAAQLAGAVQFAAQSGLMVIAHSEWVNVEADECEALLAGGALRWRDERMVVHHGVSSMLAVPRAVWDQVGGFDERFTGWGWEDRAFARACKVLGDGVQRMHGTVYHLAHERPGAEANRTTDAAYRANRALWQRYRLARTVEQLRSVRWATVAAA